MKKLRQGLSFIPLLVILASLVVRVDYRLDAPGNLEPLDGFIQFSNDRVAEANLNAIYVMSFNRPTIFQWVVGQISPGIDLTPLSEAQASVTNTARFESGQVARNTAIEKAIITAYQELGLPITYDTQQLVYLMFDYATNQGLEIGDAIVSVNGSTDIFDAFANAPCGETATLAIIQDGVSKTVEVLKNADEDCRFGFSLSTYYAIDDLPLAYQTTPTIVGGPSAGLMHTLYIYAAQNPDFVHPTINVAGTGTIGLDGRVGSVGSIKQKVYTAHQQNVDVLLIPAGANYDTALEVYDSLTNPRFDLVEISTFNDALSALEAYNAVD